MAKFSEVFTEQVEKPSNKFKTRKIQFVHYTKLEESAYQYRNRNKDMIVSLADLIKADGEILEPCIIRKSGAGSDSFELIAGHKRTLAIKYLVEEEGLEDFSFIPCIEKSFSDIRAEFAVYSTNGYDEKTPYEIMKEIEGMSRLLKDFPDEFPEFAGKGRLVEKLAKKLQMSKSVISDYQNISHNLGEKGMSSFKEGAIDKSTAVVLSSLPEEKQEEVLEKGLTKREQIKEYVSEQVKLPSKKMVNIFFQRYGKKSLKGKDISEWVEILKEQFGRSHYGCSTTDFSYDCSLRGIKIRGCDEITWKKFVELIIKYIPKSEYEYCNEQEETVAPSIQSASSAEDEIKESSIFDMSIRELVSKMDIEAGTFTIGSKESSFVLPFELKDGELVVSQQKDKDENLIGQMSIEEFL